MFPISSSAVTLILLSTVFVGGAATGYARRWRIALLSIPIFTLVVSAAGDRIDPGYGGWPFLLALAAAGGFVALGIGQIWGWLARRLGLSKRVGTWATLAFLVLPAIALTTFTLERQYLPDACRSALAVDMNGNTFLIRPEDSAFFRWKPGGSGERAYNYSLDRRNQDSSAKLCRLAAGGGELITPHQLDFDRDTPLVTSCRNGACRDTSYPAKFSLTAISDTGGIKPSAWFGDQTGNNILWGGDNADGWICFLPSGSIDWLHCQRWVTPERGIRAAASADRRPETAREILLGELESEINGWLAHLNDFDLE
jgi:hypothetical protein